MQKIEYNAKIKKSSFFFLLRLKCLLGVKIFKPGQECEKREEVFFLHRNIQSPFPATLLNQSKALRHLMRSIFLCIVNEVDVAVFEKWDLKFHYFCGAQSFGKCCVGCLGGSD